MRVVIHKNGMLEMSIINVIFLTNAEKCFRVVFLLLLMSSQIRTYIEHLMHTDNGLFFYTQI